MTSMAMLEDIVAQIGVSMKELTEQQKKTERALESLGKNTDRSVELLTKTVDRVTKSVDRVNKNIIIM